MKSVKEGEKIMKERANIQIIIRPVECRAGEYIAYYETECVQATFSVHLRDNIFGALALRSFSEMVRKAFAQSYRSSEITFMLSTESMKLENKLLLDVLTCRPVAWA